MDKPIDEKEIVSGTEIPASVPEAVVSEAPKEVAEALKPLERRPKARDNRMLRKNPRRGPRREERTRPEFDQKIISLRRVTRVVAGGRRFSFSVALVAGNRKGMVGVGTGKGGDTALSIEKAFRNAKKNMIAVPLSATGSIPFDSHAKYGASSVMIMPAPGRGLVAGGAMRTVLEFAGVKNVSGKILSRSKNGLNNAQATILALSRLERRKK